MNKRIIAIPSLIAVISVILSMLMFTSNIAIVPVYATWYRVNTDGDLNDPSKWGVGCWHESTSYVHDYYMQGGQAYTRFKTSGFNKWGNTQYGQGNDIWSSWGVTLVDIPANIPQRMVSSSITLYQDANFLYGRVNQYIELWLEHPTGDGTKNYKYAELMIILDSHGYIYQAPAQQNGYWTIERNEPGVSWYYVGYRHWDMGSNWVYRETNINAILSQMSTKWGCNLSEWTITGLSFGIEGTSGEMIALFDYVYYDVGM